MDKPFFIADNFSITRHTTVQEIIDQANAKLASALGPKVYGCYTSDEIDAHKFHKSNWHSLKDYHTKDNDLGNTHIAYLFNIQPIECQHKNSIMSEPHLAGARM